jgi:hypothetical protein
MACLDSFICTMEQVFLGLGLVHFQCFISLYVFCCCFLQKMLLLRLTFKEKVLLICAPFIVLLLFLHALLLVTVHSTTAGLVGPCPYNGLKVHFSAKFVSDVSIPNINLTSFMCGALNRTGVPCVGGLGPALLNYSYPCLRTGVLCSHCMGGLGPALLPPVQCMGTTGPATLQRLSCQPLFSCSCGLVSH